MYQLSYQTSYCR